MLRIEQSLTKVCTYPSPKKCTDGSLKGIYKQVEFVIYPILFEEDFQLHMSTGPDDKREELKNIVLDAWHSS